MKYVVVLGDGMADQPIEALGYKTPLQVANKNVIDELAKKGELGLVKTIPDDLSPGSDTANLSVLGYNPQKYYTGRSPLEAVSMGVNMSKDDVSFRCNLVTLSEDESYNNKRILDHSADEISTEEATELIDSLNEYLFTSSATQNNEGEELSSLNFSISNKDVSIFVGVSYRHLLLWHNGNDEVELTPPHDILEKCIENYLPRGANSDKIKWMMEMSYRFLKDHPINKKRIQRGLRPANSIWIWGEGRKPQLPAFEEKFNKTGAMISAVDLLKGIAIAANMTSIDVENVTGNIHTNFEGKAKAAIDTIKSGTDFVYIHIEAPDECGHRGELENKIKAIELIDKKIVKYVKEELDKIGEDYKILILPDHPTPIALRTHTRDAVPYLIYTSSNELSNQDGYTEENAKKSGRVFEKGHSLMAYFLNETE